MQLATLLRAVQDQRMQSVPNRGEGNQRGLGLVFCVFIGESAGQNRRAKEKFTAFAMPGGNPCLFMHVPKKGGLTATTLFRDNRLLPVLKIRQVRLSKVREDLN